MPKSFENGTKTDAEISDFSYLFNKGENARKYCIYNIKLGSGHLQNDEKSIKNDAKSMLEKVMQKGCQMIPK